MTLDRNELIHLRDRTGDTASLFELVVLHRAGTIEICVPAIAASENQRDKVAIESYSHFRGFLADIGLGTSTDLFPIMLIGVTYIGYSLVSGPEIQAQIEGIHHVLFPNVPFDYLDYVAHSGYVGDGIARRWINAISDTLSMWCHIYYGTDFFVTDDHNFHKATKKPRLERLGARGILRPKECVEALAKMRLAWEFGTYEPEKVSLLEVRSQPNGRR